MSDLGFGRPGLRLTRDSSLARRDFLRLLAVVSGGLALATVAVETGVFRRRGAVHDAAKQIAPTIARGDAVTFSYPGIDDPAIAVGLEDGTVAAYSSVCTHLGCAVLWSKDRGQLVCPCHDGAFDPRSGAVLAGPPPRPLPKIRLDNRADGIYATGRA
ncbi:MAG TPA: Rieske (2Fe-2S) protein [Actinomycetota bacterium]|nr:Rieske (2Fe-2S) protein [Actinomycetota bacterium]